MPSIVNGKDGKSGRFFIRLNGAGSYTELCVTQWTAREVSEEHDITGSKSAGNDEYENSTSHVEGTVTGQWQSDLNPLQAAPTLETDSQFDIRAHLNATAGAGLEDGDQFTCATCKLNNISMTVPAKGVIEFTFDYKTSGTYTYTETHV